MMPEAEIGDLIIEVRSATAGVGSFTFKFDHMAELTGRRPTRSSRRKRQPPRRRAAGISRYDTFTYNARGNVDCAIN